MIICRTSFFLGKSNILDVFTFNTLSIIQELQFSDAWTNCPLLKALIGPFTIKENKTVIYPKARGKITLKPLQGPFLINLRWLQLYLYLWQVQPSYKPTFDIVLSCHITMKNGSTCKQLTEHMLQCPLGMWTVQAVPGILSLDHYLSFSLILISRGNQEH